MIIFEIKSEYSKMTPEEENKLILNQYRKLLRTCKPSIQKGDKKQIRLAFEMALDAHKEQRRKSGEPYILHPLEVAQIVAGEIGLGAASIVCALLHDVVEDTGITLENIEMEFGKPIAKIVDGLTKISDLYVFDENTSIQAENFRKMLLTLADDVRVILIKLADRLHNMRTMDSMPEHKQIKIASETKYLYAPLAHRLGLYNLKSELEDLSMKYTNSDVYKTIADKLNATKTTRKKFINEFINPIVKKLKQVNFGFQYEIKGRPKSIFSIWNKMQKQKIDFEQVYDLFAIRIIIDSDGKNEKADCWRVYSIVTDIYDPNINRLRDWVSTPKANGYESLHTTVMSNIGKWVEVQIRTKRMNEIAEKGYAAHWKYKDGKNDNSMDLWLERIRSILENPTENALDFIDDFKMDLYDEELFVFTPKGDLKKMKKGSTALDFAFEIHTDIGMSCIGAKVNHKIVPISHQLLNGDQVEILTSKIQKPKPDWLSIVVTGKAKHKIKSVLNESKKAEATLGKETLLRKLKSWKIEFSDILMNKLLKEFGFKQALDFYYAIAIEKITTAKIKKFLQSKPKKESLKNSLISTPILKENKKDSTLIIDNNNNLNGVYYELAPCCKPIPGDKIFGYVSNQGKIKIHRVNCPNAVDLLSKHNYRVIKTRWHEKENKAPAYLSGIHITGLDDVGIISNITHVISDQEHLNMRSISVESKDGVFEGEILVYVKSTYHLTNLMNQLKKIKGILKASRFDAEMV